MHAFEFNNENLDSWIFENKKMKNKYQTANFVFKILQTFAISTLAILSIFWTIFILVAIFWWIPKEMQNIQNNGVMLYFNNIGNNFLYGLGSILNQTVTNFTNTPLTVVLHLPVRTPVQNYA